MRRLIKSAETGTTDHIELAFGELMNTCFNRGYELTVLNKGYNLVLEAKEDPKMMPIISVRSSKSNNDSIIYEVKLQFPNLDSESFDYYDSVAHYIKQWEKAGQIASAIVQFKYDPNITFDED